MAEYKTTMLIVVFISMFLISVVKNETFYGIKNQHVKIEMKSLSTYLRIDFPSKDLVVTNWYSSEVVKGYNVTFNGSIVIFEMIKLTADNEGWYKFDFSVPEEDGIHANHVTKQINVKIADIFCGINYGKDFIGENDCQERDKVDAWIKLPRPTKENLTIEWGIKEMTRNFTDIRHISETDIEAQEADAPLEVGDTFQCHSKTLKCSTNFEPQNIIYAKNKTTREMFSYHFGTMTPNNKRPVECQANTSASVTCVYHWVHIDRGVISTFPGNILLKEDFIKDGLYECYAFCKLRKNNLKPCVLLADRVEFSSVVKEQSSKLPEKSPSNIYFNHSVIGMLVLAFIFYCAFLYFLYRSFRYKRHNGSNGLLTSSNQYSSTLYQENDRPQHQPKDYDYESLVGEVVSVKCQTELLLKSHEWLWNKFDYLSKLHTILFFHFYKLLSKGNLDKSRKSQFGDHFEAGNLLKGSSVDLKDETAERRSQEEASNEYLDENETPSSETSQEEASNVRENLPRDGADKNETSDVQFADSGLETDLDR